jgi:sugar-specific transcriptional regulator TrmB
MFEQNFTDFGLTKTQAKLFDYLLENGAGKARDLARAINHPRGVIYKTLEELLQMGLIEKKEEKGQIARFLPTHPRNLEKLLEEREKNLALNKKSLEEIMPRLSSGYNLLMHKPGVKFYEGEEGMKKILFDTLYSQTEVYLFIYPDAISQVKGFKEIDDDYIEKRIHFGIKKKILRAGKKPAEVPQKTENKKTDLYDQLTEIRYLEKEFFPFKSSLQIYDNKISYQIIDGENVIGILVEDKNIFEMHKAFFETLWEQAV